jgi:hypothetical protein
VAGAEATGNLTAELTATGPDGATYTLSGVSLRVSWTTDAGLQTQTIPLDGTSSTLTYALPVGSFTATLVGGADAQIGYTLNRAGDGGPTSVPAALLDPQPYAFAIAANTTTNLALHFAIAGVGPVTFGSGTLNTTLSAEAGAFPVSQGNISGPLTITSASSSGNPGAALIDLVTPDDGGTTINIMTLNPALAASFTMGIDRACAPISLYGAAPYNGAPQRVQNLSALFDDATYFSSGTLCFYDANDPTYPNGVTVTSSFSHPPYYATSAFPTDAGPATFSLNLVGKLTKTVFVNGALSLSLLNQPLAMTVTSFSESAALAADAGQVTASASAGTLTLQMLP